MPNLPLPVGGANLNAGDLPIVDVASIAALEPHLVSDSDSAPVRDAVRAGLTAMFTYYQDATATAAMQSNVLFATGIYLDGLGADEGVFRQTTEPYSTTGDAAYRARIILQGGTVAPAYVLAAANSVLAPYSTIPARYLESLSDRAFLRSNLSNPNVAFLRDGKTVGNCNPEYADRLYPDDAAANSGFSVAARQPGGFWVFSDCVGRFFVLRVPSLSGLDSSGAFPWNGLPNGNGVLPETLDNGFFVSNGSVVPPPAWGFLRTSSATSAGVYQAIVNAVSRLVGHSIRWSLVVDQTLS